MSDFDKVVEARTEAIKLTLMAKAKEYVSNGDRFHNFNVAARIGDTTPEVALLGMMSKHIVSVLDLITWAGVSPDRITRELIDEKIGDNINYLILLEGMLKQNCLGGE